MAADSQEPTKPDMVVAPPAGDGAGDVGGVASKHGPPVPLHNAAAGPPVPLHNAPSGPPPVPLVDNGPADRGCTKITKRIFPDAVLAKVEMDRKLSMIKAWEESEKSKAENKAQKKMSSILAWENSKKAAVEAKLRTRELSSLGETETGREFLIKFRDSCSCICPWQEKLEKKKAEYAEKMRNQIAAIHKEAEEKRALVEATRHEEIIRSEETAAKHRSKGTTPNKKFLGCF
ncbi:hypothetical protein PR202_ga03446 [Eleusine coracana subsp. coracana]|uniref:Remorin C-terminal domain-containing protein n=1 Tax=Eleusine coracana subsp. coracana TaxID=191504 RepID=A0AAV5BMN0_ELECO|nr:hypothetical protein PR202_ga03446 [Eleusine coracana subsp. coracana]